MSFDSENETIPICGLPAVKALFEKRPKAIVRLSFLPELRREVGEICSYLANNKRSYTQKPWDALMKISRNSEHGGVVAAAEPKTLAKFQIGRLMSWHQKNEPILLLYRIPDERALGQIAQTASFFGIHNILIEIHPEQCLPTGITYQASNGAMEYVQIHQVESFRPLMKPLRDKFLTIAIGGEGASNIDWKKKAQAPGRPPALIMGSTLDSLDPKIVSLCEHNVKIPGPTPERSLDTSANASITMAWLLSEKRKSPQQQGFRARQKAAKAEKKK